GRKAMPGYQRSGNQVDRIRPEGVPARRVHRVPGSRLCDSGRMAPGLLSREGRCHGVFGGKIQGRYQEERPGSPGCHPGSALGTATRLISCPLLPVSSGLVHGSRDLLDALAGYVVVDATQELRGISYRGCRKVQAHLIDSLGCERVPHPIRRPIFRKLDRVPSGLEVGIEFIQAILEIRLEILANPSPELSLAFVDRPVPRAAEHVDWMARSEEHT